MHFQKKPYSFTYGVRDSRSGADFEQNEERSGHVTRGSYKVVGGSVMLTEENPYDKG